MSCGLNIGEKQYKLSAKINLTLEMKLKLHISISSMMHPLVSVDVNRSIKLNLCGYLRIAFSKRSVSFNLQMSSCLMKVFMLVVKCLWVVRKHTVQQQLLMPCSRHV